MAQNLENFLCTFHKKRYAHIVGNGTTAIYLAIKSLSNKIKYIGIPNNTCIHLPIAIKLANRIPVYLDIEKKGYGLSIKDLKKAKINCLINVHAYGKPSKIDKIKEICLKKKIFLIEDLALAQGGYYKKNPLGSFGNISILSFGKGKVVDAGIGGAMLTDDPNIYKLSKKIKNSFKLVNTNNLKHVSYINNLHTKIYNNYFLENKKINIKNFRRIIKLKSKYFLFNISPEQINKIYKKCLNLPKIVNGEVPWRLNIFFKDCKKRNLLLKKLLHKKINVSSWYSGLDFFFKKNLNLKYSEQHSKSILNLWINEKYDKTYLTSIIKSIHQI